MNNFFFDLRSHAIERINKSSLFTQKQQQQQNVIFSITFNCVVLYRSQHEIPFHRNVESNVSAA